MLDPNGAGSSAALELEAHAGQRPVFNEVNVFMSASETHNRKQRRTGRSPSRWRASNAVLGAGAARRACAARR